jgi:O-antigen/teichoic acid export membrane protein
MLADGGRFISPGLMIEKLQRFRRWAGVDRAVFFSNAAQMMRLITGPITMTLVLRYLTPEIQGYFYAFAGIVAMQSFLELGFSQNILQFASHEYAKLHFTESRELEGDLEALSRIISLGRLAFGYYAVAAVIFWVAVGIGGQIFFTISAHHETTTHAVAWRGAWWLIVTMAALSLAVNPARSLLDGCGQVALNAKFGFLAALANFAANALALIGGAGIYVAAISAACSLLFTLAYMGLCWRKFFAQFLTRPQHGQISWWHEIWPFQWRIAVTWMSGYFIFDVVSPIAFYFCGAVEAGRLGMSLQLVRMVYNVAMTWIFTKMPRFGMLVGARAWQELDILWRQSTLQSFSFFLLGISAFLILVPVAGLFFPRIPARLAPFGVNAWLGAAMLAQVLITAMSLELRAHKREPYMWLSVANAILSMAFILPLVHWLGIYGEAMGYALGMFVIALPAYKIYRIKRLEYRRSAGSGAGDPVPMLEPDPASGNFS